MSVSIDWQVLSLQLVTTFAHFLWQGAAIGGVLAVVLRLWTRRTANVRYITACLAFAMLPACVVGTFALVTRNGDAIFVARGDSQNSIQALAPRNPNSEPPRVSQLVPPVAADKQPSVEPLNVASQSVDVEPKDRSKRTLSGRLTFLSPYLFGLYLIGVLAMLLRFGISILSSGRLRHACRMIEDAAMVQIIAEQAARSGLKRIPFVGLCDRVAVPIVLGILKPVILLPPAILCGLDPQQLAAILSHEMAHIRRYDMLVNLTQRIVEALLFFHPTTWSISRSISIERENCCDDMAVAGCGHLEFARALLAMAELCARSRGLKIAPQLEALAADGGNSSQLSNRIHRLLGEVETPRPILSRTALATLCMAVVVCGSLSLAVFAQSQEPFIQEAEASATSEAEALLRKVLERSQFWAGRRSESLKSLYYDYDLNGRRQEIKLVSGISRVPRSQWDGATLSSGMHLLSADASSFAVSFEEIKTDANSGDDIVRLKCRKKDPTQSLGVAFGNGVDGRWTGYFSHGIKAILLDVDRKTMLPTREQLDGTSVSYSHWKAADNEHSVPGIVRVQHEASLWEMNFDWVGNSAWLLTYTETGAGANRTVIARTLNVKVNDQDVLRELTDKEKQRQASTAPVRMMLERNRLWLQPELSEADSLSYTFHALREDIKEACFLNKDGVAVFEITHDGEIKPSGREKESNTGRRSLALPNGQWASGDRSQEYLYIHEPNRERSEAYSLRLRRYGLIGCQFDLPLFRINEVLDNLRTTTTTGEWNGIECEVVSMSGTGRNAWLGAGTMLAFSSSSYIHHIYPASTTLYLDKVRHVPLHESIRGGRDKDFEIDYSDWKEAEPGQWVPLSIKVESKDYFTCEYQFQVVAGKHWMLKELTSWFDAANKSRAVVSDVEINKPSDLWNQAKTQLDKTERLFSRPTEVADRSNASSVTLQTTPIEFGHWTAIDDVQVMLTVASIKSLILRAETKQEPTMARLPIVLFDSQGRPVECGSVALQQVDDKWAGELLLSNIDANNLTEIAVAGRGGNTKRTISVEPIQIGICQPVNFPDNQQGKTRAAEFEVTQPENSDLMARVKVVSVNGPKGFPVVVDVILFDGQDQPIRCAQHRESFRVDGKPDIHDVVVNLGAIPLTVPTARAAVIVRNERATTFPMGSGWGMRMGFAEIQVPVEKLFAAEDPACRAIAVLKIISQLNDRNIEKEFFEEPRDRARLAERKQLASDIVGPFVMQLESILQIQTDESLQRDAARLLGFSGDISRVDRLLTLLDAKDEATRDVAAIALAMLKSDAGIGRFAPILERPVPDIETERDAWRQFSRTQQDALIALATLNSDAAVDLLGDTMIRDLQTLTLNQSDNGRTHLTGRADRAGRILSLSQRLNNRIVPWLGKAVEYFENNPTIGKEFSQSALAMALLKHQGKSKTTIESQIRKLNNSYVDAIRESRNPYYRSAIQEMLLNENSGPWMFQKGVDYLSGINTPESIAFLKELYDRRLPEDISARMRLCESLVQFNDERGLVEALKVMSDSFADPTTGPDGVALKKDVKLQEEKRKRSEYVLRRASNDMILKVVAEQINADINNDSNIQTCRAILVFLRSTGTLPEEIEQSVRQWATHDDASLKSEASEFLETRGILPQK